MCNFSIFHGGDTMFEGSGYEHIVKQKVEGGLLARKACLVIAYIMLLTLPSFLVLSFCPMSLVLPLLILIASLTVVAYLMTWRYTSVEFEYSIFGDTISFVSIYGKKSRKGKLDVAIKNFSEIGKYTDAAEKHLEEVVIDKDYLFMSHILAEHLYYGLFDDDGDKCIVYFEATDKAISLLKKYNPTAFRAYERETRKFAPTQKEKIQNKEEE